MFKFLYSIVNAVNSRQTDRHTLNTYYFSFSFKLIFYFKYIYIYISMLSIIFSKISLSALPGLEMCHFVQVDATIDLIFVLSAI